MRYYLDATTLFIHGAFRAASTGSGGGIMSVSTLLNHMVKTNTSWSDPVKELERVAAGSGISREFFGVLTAVPITSLCVLQYDFITVFVTAGTETVPDTGMVNIIVYSSEGMADSTLLEMIMVATEAKTRALLASGHDIPGPTTNAIITACEGEVHQMSAERIAGIRERVFFTVQKGVPEALSRSKNPGGVTRPAFFIYSRFNGEHWVEWTPENCPYYPCHFEGQRCDFCYCPFYPCGDERLGDWTTSSNHGQVWNCARCTLVHEPEVADYLKKYPGASLEELRHLKERK
ncbi:MAG: cysteine-rich small domain-containing protein [Methanoregula sp.]